MMIMTPNAHGYYTWEALIIQGSSIKSGLIPVYGIPNHMMNTILKTVSK